MRKWLVTARDENRHFLDQRTILAASQFEAEADAFQWILSKKGVPIKSDLKEITK